MRAREVGGLKCPQPTRGGVQSKSFLAGHCLKFVIASKLSIAGSQFTERQMLRLLFFLLVVGTSIFASAQAAERRAALVVGVSNYKHAPVLANTLNDARAIAKSLGRLGFDVELAVDPDRSSLEAAIRRLGQRAQLTDATLFYYAGHALEVNGQNLLVPASADIQSAQDLRFETVDLDLVLDGVSGSSRVSILLMDSCRDNPFTKKLVIGSRSTSRSGLGAVDSSIGTLIAFATAPGKVAEDGEKAHSPFTQALLDNIEQPGVEVRRMMSNVRREVRELTGGRQVPWENSALEGDFYFKAPIPSPQPTDNPSTQSQTAVPHPVSLASALMETLVAGLPYQSSQSLESTVQRYEQALPNKAQAIAIAASSTWYVYARGSPLEAEEGALEGCQIRFSEPCTLAAVNENVLQPADKATWTRRDMRRVEYAGEFSPDHVPAISPATRASDGVRSYVSAIGPKAVALHPWGRQFIKTSASSSREAELDVLSRCNSDPVRGGKDGPCFLYAIGNHVVLPLRMIDAHKAVTTIAQAVPLVTDPVALRNYRAISARKALAVEPDGGTYYYWDGASSKETAENFALVGCQLQYSKPCILLAIDDDLQSGDPITAERRDMAQLHYKGPFVAERTPLLSLGNREIIVSYAKLPSPKALAIRPYHAKVASATGSTVAEAERNALASCNTDPRWPCFIYAINDEVVLSERRTDASK
jgi:uncharacterized caspase-like protein